MLRPVGLALAFLATLLSVWPADAAVRRCQDFIATAGEDRASEIVAKQ